MDSKFAFKLCEAEISICKNCNLDSKLYNIYNSESE